MKQMKETNPRKPAILDLDLSHVPQKLKQVPKEIIIKFIRSTCNKLCNKLGYDFIESTMNNSKVMTIMSNTSIDGEEILTLINKTVAYEFGDFIENEMKENRKLYDRSITLFESSIGSNRVTIYCLS